MEINQRLDVLIQSAEIAQKFGILSLDEAVVVKESIDNIKSNKCLKESIQVLVKTAHYAQSKGAYTLRDAYYIFISIDGIEKELSSIIDENPTEESEPLKGQDKKEGEE